MAKKTDNRKNHAANAAWKERKRTANQQPSRKEASRQYRLGALETRLREDRFTPKNEAEAKSLGHVPGHGRLKPIIN